MLVLQRKPGESLVIGEDIQVSVVSVENGRVRLAITAPADVPILRSELVKATAANRDSAMAPKPDDLKDLIGSLAEHVHEQEHHESQREEKPSPEGKVSG